jgi:D-lactate dehydrogenase (cytochrome)
MSNACRTRPPRGEDYQTGIIQDPEVIAAHLEDAAHFAGGHAAGVAYPRSEAAVARVVREHRRVLPVGAQSSLTGGATPFGDVVLSTARMSGILTASASRAVVQAGVTLDALQAALAPHGAVYPPVPTFGGATMGGAVATNAAGAATFKYGSTRDWVEGLSVVLADGECLDLTRGECLADDRGFLIQTSRGERQVPVGRYTPPAVPKRSAGYHAAPGMDLVDLFIGAEGTLGVITSVTVRTLSPAPAVALALVFCPSEQHGIELAAALRSASLDTWRRQDPYGIDACAIEHLDDRSLALVRGDLARLHVTVPAGTDMALLVQLELPPGTTASDAYEQIGSARVSGSPDTSLGRLCRLLARFDVLDRTELAVPGDAARQQQLLACREAVPARVNQLVGAAQRDVDPRIDKTAADMIVPFERFGDMMAIYRRGFEARGLQFAIWGHISDGNVHPNVLPASYEDVLQGRDAILEFGREVARLGGCPLAEHGVGRNATKQALLQQLYGEAGIADMRAIKRALDPEWKLAPGVIWPPLHL